MKIFFRISRLGFGGAERVFFSIAEYLSSSHGYEVIFVADTLDGEGVAIAAEKGFLVRALDVMRTSKSIFAFKRLLEYERPDLVLTAYPDTNGAAILSRFISSYKCPIIVTEHASIKQHWAIYPRHWQLRVKLIVKYLYRHASAVVCVSNGLKKEVRDLMGSSDQVLTIYNPVRFSSTVSVARAEHANTDVKTILAVGRLSKPKDYPTLLKAFALLENKNTCLKIVGGVYDQAVWSELNSLISDLGIASRIDFVGYSDHPDLFYQSADLFVLSSAWEGFGNVIVEALAFGVPVVSTDCPSGPSEILCGGKFGELVPVGDSIELANRMDRILSGAIKYNSDDLRRRAQDFSEKNIGQQYYNLIREVLSG
ncbi:glycosyltransferase [Chitinibacter tainanensis]|uniref:glycosyltransferase n=1 Tax=Chitinibacter tainanensis TaxID=230667 RepID=UPI002355C0D8|nr:glycosyltransferase [Chitinibacter tainanensis]